MSIVISPSEQFYKRAHKAFKAKKFIGDIPISDDEFVYLTDHLKRVFNAKRSYGFSNPDDPILCIALVQIGVRFYDGSFWRHVANILECSYLNANQQSKLSTIFLLTMEAHGKPLLKDNERVNSILMHGFVSANYADRFFSFLFAFYEKDLDRDISRLDRTTMNDLTEVIKANDKRKRTYFLVEQTADAVRQNTRGAKMRIRRYLNLIDRVFWGETLYFNKPNRLTSRFMDWTFTSDDFLISKRKYHGGAIVKRGKKSFSSPYIKWSTASNTFTLVLPPQIIRYSDELSEQLSWAIKINTEQVPPRKMQLYEVVTGYKSEKDEMQLPPKNLFADITAAIADSSDNIIRTFRIKNEKIRFFDSDGDMIPVGSVGKGQVYSFSGADFIPESEAIEDVQRFDDLTLTCYNFEVGDVVLLPDGKPLSIGKKICEGLLPRGVVNEVLANIDGEKCSVYSSPPSAILILHPDRAKGTAIIVDNKRYNLHETDPIKFNLDNRSGNVGYKVSLKNFNCDVNKIYDVIIDVPNDRQSRFYRFALINDFKYEFEDAPYIFRTRGTITFPDWITVTPTVPYAMKCPVAEGNSVNFDITTDTFFLPFVVDGVEIDITVPALYFRFDGEDWQTDRYTDVWHSDFNTKLFLKYPSDTIAFTLDDNDEFDDNDYVQEETFRKIQSGDMFECDLNRFKSWFGRDKIFRRILLKLGSASEAIVFMDVYTKSYLVSHIIKADYRTGILYGDFDIIGRSNYYVDVSYDGRLIAEKLRLEDGRFEFRSELFTGEYHIILYESEDDDSGFGDNVYYEIESHYEELINPDDLADKTIEVSRIIDVEKRTANISLSCRYSIGLTAKTDAKNYTGKMSAIAFDDRVLVTIPVNVEFFDEDNLNETYITFFQDDEQLEFLYDESRRIIVKEEDPALNKKAAYRRYKRSLYPEDYIFMISFIG